MYIGLCVTSHNNSLLSTATFDNVAVSTGANLLSVATTTLNSTNKQNAIAGTDTTSLAASDVRSLISPSGESNSSAVIFPNPFTGIITISLETNNPYFRAKIIDMYGKITMEWNIRTNETEITKDLGSLSNGIYLLRLEGATKTEIIRIEKQ